MTRVGAGDAVENGAAASVDLKALAGDVDGDDDASTLSFSVITAPAVGAVTLSGSRLGFDAGSHFEDLAVGETRDVEIRARVMDVRGATADSIATITVAGMNDGPVAVADDNDSNAIVEVDFMCPVMPPRAAMC